MKVYVMIVNSIMLILMASLAVLQTGCTPITPSLDRRLFVQKKDSQPSTASDPVVTATPDYSKRESINSVAKLRVSIKVDDDLLALESDDDQDDEDLNTCDVNELDFDSVELFKKNYGQIQLTLADPRSNQFEFDLALSAKEAKSFDTKEIAIVFLPTDSKDTWNLQLAPKQEDPKLAKKVEMTVHSIQWKSCHKLPKKTQVSPSSISGKQPSVI